MFRWLLLASSVVAVSLAEEPAPAAEAVVPDPKAEESAHHYDHPDLRYNDYGEDLPGTGVLREIHPSKHPLPHKRIEEQNKIVYARYSPNYYQPTWILDYRYLKTGGRDYVRGEGGQILILPKGMKAPPDEHKQFGNFDELLEHLRLQELAEREDLHLRRTGQDKHHEDEHQNYKDNRKQTVGWQREAQREQRYDDKMDEMIKEILENDGRDNRRERWYNRGQRQQVHGWEQAAFNKK